MSDSAKEEPLTLAPVQTETRQDEDQKEDHNAALLPADPSAVVSTEALPSLKYETFVERATYWGDTYGHDAPTAMRMLMREWPPDALKRIGSGTPASQEHAVATVQERSEKDKPHELGETGRVAQAIQRIRTMGVTSLSSIDRDRAIQDLIAAVRAESEARILHLQQFLEESREPAGD